jgi:hypothetical protein
MRPVRKWNWILLNELSAVAGLNPTSLRYIINRLVRDLDMDFPMEKKP